MSDSDNYVARAFLDVLQENGNNGIEFGLLRQIAERLPSPGGMALVPAEPTEAQWGGLRLGTTQIFGLSQKGLCRTLFSLNPHQREGVTSTPCLLFSGIADTTPKSSGQAPEKGE